MSRYAEAHKWANLAGPGDGRPTAEQIVKDCSAEDCLKGKIILITGVSSGLGAASAIALAATGATVVGAGRSIPKAKTALSAIADYPNLHLMELDLASQTSVTKFALEFLVKFKAKVNILMNNAGGILTDYQVTEDGVEWQFAINYVSQFLLFSLLKDALISSATSEFPSRVVNLSSVGHRLFGVQFDNLDAKDKDYNSYVAYSQAKTASVYLATEIERRYGSKSLHAWSVHPGCIIESAFLDNSRFDKGTIDSILQAWPMRIHKTNEQGAATQVWAAISSDVLAKEALGKYLEDVSVSIPKEETENPEYFGYVDHTYDQVKAVKMWEISENMLGVKL